MDLRPILSAVSRFRPGLVPQKPSMSSVANVITCLYNYETTGVPTVYPPTIGRIPTLKIRIRRIKFRLRGPLRIGVRRLSDLPAWDW